MSHHSSSFRFIFRQFLFYFVSEIQQPAQKVKKEFLCLGACQSCAPIGDQCVSCRPAAPRHHPAVHGNPGEPAVHRRARPPHPGRLPAVLRPAALRDADEVRSCAHAVPDVITRLIRNYLLLHQESPLYVLFVSPTLCSVPMISVNVQPRPRTSFKVGIQTLVCHSWSFFIIFIIGFVLSLVDFYLLLVFL